MEASTDRKVCSGGKKTSSINWSVNGADPIGQRLEMAAKGKIIRKFLESVQVRAWSHAAQARSTGQRLFATSSAKHAALVLGGGGAALALCLDVTGTPSAARACSSAAPGFDQQLPPIRPTIPPLLHCRSYPPSASLPSRMPVSVRSNRRSTSSCPTLSVVYFPVILPLFFPFHPLLRRAVLTISGGAY